MRIEDQAILSTFVEMFKSYLIEPVDQPQLQYDPDATVFMSCLNDIFFNGVCIKNPIDEERLVEEIWQVHCNTGRPLIAWLTQDTQSHELEHIFGQRFVSPGPFYGMLLDLKKANMPPIAENITIELIKTREQADLYGRIFCDVFYLPNIVDYIIDWTITEAELEEPVCMNYFAKVDGVIAGISSFVIDRKFKHFKTGGIYNVFVYPEFRKLGVATAMACANINLARELGMEHISIVLMPDAMARGYSEKLGFKNYGIMMPYYIEAQSPNPDDGNSDAVSE
ncbi:MAG: hypothetical protein QG673_678 [Pseudomonadota bacterium]|nr:hypothetical protein [Pseudomonadota bacterium]